MIGIIKTKSKRRIVCYWYPGISKEELDSWHGSSYGCENYDRPKPKDVIEQIVEDYDSCFRFGGYTEETMGQIARSKHGCSEDIAKKIDKLHDKYERCFNFGGWTEQSESDFIKEHWSDD